MDSRHRDRSSRRSRSPGIQPFLGLALLAGLAWVGAATFGFVEAEEIVAAKIEGREVQVSGRIVVEAQDGGLLLETGEGRQYTFEPADIISRSTDARPFTPMSGEALGEALRARLGGSFQIHRTQHYVIAYETSPAFAVWVGALFERLLRGFEAYWSQRGLELADPEFPLPIVIFGSQDRFREHAEVELGGDPGGIVAYYHLLHNEVVLYDLTESDAGTGGARSNGERIDAILSRPEAYALVATIVHEATHQVAYNTGLQRRLSDVPMWINEGLATFFETPDLRSRSGWRGIGLENSLRMPQLRQLLASRRPNSIEQLIVDDQRFRNPETLLDAYAESWGLVFYLAKVKKDEFSAYLAELSQKSPLGEDGPEARLETFRRHFGEDLEALDREFTRYMLRRR